jgi:hypothetical protein
MFSITQEGLIFIMSVYFIAGLLIGYIKGKEANPKPTNTTQSQLK